MTKKDEIEKPVKIGCLVQPRVRNEFKSKAAKEGLSIKEALTKLVEDYIKVKNGKCK